MNRKRDVQVSIRKDCFPKVYTHLKINEGIPRVDVSALMHLNYT